MTRAPTPSRNKGFALPAAVWLTLFLFVLLAGILSFTAGQRDQVSGAVQRERLRLAAESAIESGIKRLLDARGSWPEILADNPSAFMIDGSKVEVRLSNEAGRINLNTSDAELMEAYFREIDIPGVDGDRLARDVLAFRERHLFRSVEEITRVEGLPPELFAMIREDFTVYSGAPGVVAEFTTPRVKTVLDRLGRNSGTGLSLLKPEEFNTGAVWRFHAEAKSPDGFVLRLDKVVRLTATSHRPFQVLLDRESF